MCREVGTARVRFHKRSGGSSGSLRKVGDFVDEEKLGFRDLGLVWGRFGGNRARDEIGKNVRLMRSRVDWFFDEGSRD